MITKAKLIICIAAVTLTVIISDLAMPRGEKSIYDTTVRLHILANSDSREDQDLKLEVRDAIIENSPYLEMITDIDALQAEITRIAQEAAKGQAVRAEFGKEYYETREYDGVMFPAGTYSSLRIIIGEGEGKNWWCVVFPTLCFSASAEEFDSIAAGAGFSESLTGAITGEDGYEVRFFFLDALGRLENLLGRK